MSPARSVSQRPAVSRQRPRTPHRDPLIGRWFHSFHADGRTVIWQGQILGLTHGRYLVQLYEWVLGEPSTERLIPVADVAGWQFYPSAQAKNDWYENVYSPRREQERRSGASSA